MLGDYHESSVVRVIDVGSRSKSFEQSERLNWAIDIDLRYWLIELRFIQVIDLIRVIDQSNWFEQFKWLIWEIDFNISDWFWSK